VDVADTERLSRIVKRPQIPDSPMPNATLSSTNAAAQPGIAGTVRGRLIRGFGATALSPIVTAIVQIVSVPVFLHFWGVKLYGEWLIISAVPIYLVLSDLGFGNVAANDMTMLVAAGDREGALETFQSTWALILITSALVEISILSAIWFLPLTRWLNLSSISAPEVRLILILFSAYVLFTLQTGLIITGFRCEGNFAYGTLLNNIVRLVEFMLTIGMVAHGGNPLRVVAVLLIAHVMGIFVMSGLMRRKSPWLRYGFRYARLASVRRLASPAVAFMAFPAGSALSLQGMVVVVGIVLGPVAVATFSTIRTLTRFGFQIIDAIKNSVWPELSAAYGAQNWELARKLHRAACQAALCLSLAAVAFLLVGGGRIFRFWTHGHVIMDVGAFRWLLVGIVANSFWYTSLVVTIASNTHERVAAFYMAGTAGSLILARCLMPHFGISGAAMSLLMIDIVLGWYVVRMSLARLEDRVTDFGAALLRLPREVSLLRSLGWGR
jgi:O-antigen/teichoic acid export membrane protein